MSRLAITQVRRLIRERANPAQAKISAGFFKTKKGEYGHGDVFLGLNVPQSRVIAKQGIGLSLKELKSLLKSKYHEERMIALLILVHQFQQGDQAVRQHVVDFYLASLDRVNNWDLVDLSADKILGAHLVTRGSSKLLDSLAKSRHLWTRRVAMIATFAFIKQGKIAETFHVADLLLKDEHDLMHKAVGWMLREAGKRDQKALERYLKTRYKKMPRTMLRYAIERFPKPLYRKYLEGRI